MLLGVLDPDSKVLWESREASTGQTEDELVELLVREIGEAHDACPGAAAVGLGIPATIDHDKGIAVSAVNLPLENLPIREIVGGRTGLPVFVDNDATVAALAEHLYGAARGAENAVMLTIGTGIGGGLILGGEVYRGSTGAGAELGHTVIDADGPPCQGNCPGRGCIETLASGTALGREGRAAAEREPDSVLGQLKAAGEEVDGKAVTEAALGGDATAVGVFDLIGSRLGVALTSFANIFEPEVFVIGGGVIAAGDLLLEPARRELAARALPPMKRIPVVAAELGADAGMMGISDPGYRLIRRCLERALDVTVLPGPSVVPVALVASGLPTDRWRFEGFLPKRSGEMERVLRSAETVIAFESPRRVGESLGALAAIAPDRPAAVCREMTKMHEEVARGSLAELARRFRGDVKGEIVLVIGPAAAEDHDRDVGFAVDALRHLVQSGARPRAAASVVAALTGTRANDLYRALTGREPRR
jgi:glucokinase